MDFGAQCQDVLDLAAVVNVFDAAVNSVSRWGIFRDAVEALRASVTVANAVAVVNAFDQADTNQAITGVNGKGEDLSRALNFLREILNRDGQQTVLTIEQAGCLV